MNDLQVQSWSTDKPIPYARNSRKIPERAIDKVGSSIQEFGFRVPIVVDKDGVMFMRGSLRAVPLSNDESGLRVLNLPSVVLY
jgi:hypothetical protein